MIKSAASRRFAEVTTKHEGHTYWSNTMSEQINYDRRRVLTTAASSLAVAGFGMIGSASAQSTIDSTSPSFAGATRWLNSPPLTMRNLRRKVVLVDFWTYTCINWRRTLPYIRAWNDKYPKHGLVLVGVHTPEFDFEKDAEDVTRASVAMGIKYPIAMDNEYAIWRSFENQYWPALYFIDARGQIQSHNFGEDNYQQSERLIQQLLLKEGTGGFDRELASVDATGAEAAAAWSDLGSQENYVGYERTENFSSPGGLARRKCRSYGYPTTLKLNHWALAGSWTAEKHAVASNAARARVAYRFHARDLHLVMSPASRGTPVRFHVLLDGLPPGAAHGTDIDEQGTGVLTEPRMYQLIRQPKPIVDRSFEIEFVDSGAEAFSFTFG
jgi:thiol-disulfide isomerase/thioredoxin